MKKILSILTFCLFYVVSYATPDARVTNVTFDKDRVTRGDESVTATVTIKNTGTSGGTFYVTVSSKIDTYDPWYDFMPMRKAVTIDAGSSGSVQVSWLPGTSVDSGISYVYLKVFKDASGADYYTDYEVVSAFSVVSNPNSESLPLTKGILIYHNYSNYEAWDSKLYMYDFSTKIKTQLGSGWNIKHAMNAHFSPDGSRIVFMGSDVDIQDWDIYIWDVGSATPPINLTRRNGQRDEDPKFSPDGKKIIFKQSEIIKVMNLSGSILNEVTIGNKTIEGSMPYYTPDGRKVIYAKGANEFSDIYIVDIDGNNNRPLYSENNVSEYYPIVRDHSTFFYSKWLSPSNRNDQIYLADIEGNSTSLSLNDQSSNNSDAYPVDDDYLFFSSTRSGGRGGYDLYLGQISTGKVWDLNSLNLNTHLEELGACFFSMNPGDGVFNEMAGKQSLNVYGSRGAIYVVSDGADIQEVKVYDLRGMELYQSKVNNTSHEVTQRFIPGMYIVNIKTDHGVVSKKITTH